LLIRNQNAKHFFLSPRIFSSNLFRNEFISTTLEERSKNFLRSEKFWCLFSFFFRIFSPFMAKKEKDLEIF